MSKTATATKRSEPKKLVAKRAPKAKLDGVRLVVSKVKEKPESKVAVLAADYRSFFASKWESEHVVADGFMRQAHHETDAEKKARAALAKRAAELVKTPETRDEFFRGVYPADFE